MRKQSAKIIIAVILIAVSCMGIYSCGKDMTYAPPARAFLMGQATVNYQITAPNVVVKIPVGVTNVEQTDRTINIAVSSPTGAVAGTHYNIPASITIPAGKAVDTLILAAVYNQYLTGRTDVLEITISGDAVKAAGFLSKVTVNITGPCFEGDIVLSEMEGDYENTMDGTYGPYVTSVVDAVSSGPTSAILTISNVFDWGWGDLQFTIDWSDPANPVVQFDPQATGFDGGNLNAGAAGHEVWVVPPTNGDMGSYSYCDKTITLNYRLCMPTLGGACFTGTFTTEMAR